MNIALDKKITLASGREVEITIEASVVNGGIGSYEFWGARGYQSYPEIDEIDFTTKETLSEDERKEIDLRIENQEFDDEIYNNVDSD